MKTEDIGNTVAKACNWTYDHNPNSDCLYRTADGRGMFNPTCCLNAMHEAEKVIPALKRLSYMQTLQRVVDETCGGNAYATMATAAQRAEAFIITMSLWTP